MDRIRSYLERKNCFLKDRSPIFKMSLHEFNMGLFNNKKSLHKNLPNLAYEKGNQTDLL